MTYIFGGCILLARQILQSELWQRKPSWWLKVWLYILTRVSHQDHGSMKRGQGHFTRLEIFENCHLLIDGVKPETVDNVIRWLKKTTQATTRKTTRGMVITVCNYERYQNMGSYRNDTQNDTTDDSETTHERFRNDTIYNKNGNNGKINQCIKTGFYNNNRDKNQFSALLRGSEALIQTDPIQLGQKLSCGGVDPLKALAAVYDCQLKQNPAGYLIKILSDPKFGGPSDASLARAKKTLYGSPDQDSGPVEIEPLKPSSIARVSSAEAEDEDRVFGPDQIKALLGIFSPAEVRKRFLEPRGLSSDQIHHLMAAASVGGSS